MIPTVGFNMKKVTKGNVTIKLWDIGGQPRFRSMWERYCRGVNAIVYVPSHDTKKRHSIVGVTGFIVHSDECCSPGLALILIKTAADMW